MDHSWVCIWLQCGRPSYDAVPVCRLLQPAWWKTQSSSGTDQGKQFFSFAKTWLLQCCSCSMLCRPVCSVAVITIFAPVSKFGLVWGWGIPKEIIQLRTRKRNAELLNQPRLLHLCPWINVLTSTKPCVSFWQVTWIRIVVCFFASTSTFCAIHLDSAYGLWTYIIPVWHAWLKPQGWSHKLYFAKLQGISAKANKQWDFIQSTGFKQWEDVGRKGFYFYGCFIRPCFFCILGLVIKWLISAHGILSWWPWEFQNLKP